MLKGEFEGPSYQRGFDMSLQSQGPEAGGLTETEDYFEGIFAKMSIIEDKPLNSKRLKFNCTGEFSLDYPVMLALYEVIGSNLKLIYQTTPVEK